jgi:hypothetical protein
MRGWTSVRVSRMLAFAIVKASFDPLIVPAQILIGPRLLPIGKRT